MSEHRTAGEAETVALGQRLGATLQSGDVVTLAGPLGAGKTAFARGLAMGLGCDPEAVSSPTFTIAQQYAGRVPLQHVDLYRLSPDEVDDLALEDLMDGAVLAIEWPDRWRRVPEGAVRVTIDVLEDDKRRVTISAH